MELSYYLTFHVLYFYARYLYIPLVSAERAWSLAMQLKQESNTEPRKKFHVMQRLKKAVKFAEELETLAQSDKFDARSKLEAQVSHLDKCDAIKQNESEVEKCLFF